MFKSKPGRRCAAALSGLTLVLTALRTGRSPEIKRRSTPIERGRVCAARFDYQDHFGAGCSGRDDQRGFYADRLERSATGSNWFSTPGAISLNFIAAYIPRGQRNMSTTSTRTATGAVSGTVTQAAAESNGVFATVGMATVHLRYSCAVGLRSVDYAHHRHLWVA